MSLLKGKATFKLLATVFFITSITFLAYYPALSNGFLAWDTRMYVVDNPNIKALTWENLRWMIVDFHASNWHPLTWYSHALDYAWFGLDPRGHHLVSIIIHCLNTALLFVLVIAIISYRTSIKDALGFVPIDKKTLMAAGTAAILFGIHPQHVESVVWVAERKDVLCLLFVLLALLSYVVYNAVDATKIRVYLYLATLAFFILALLSKPMAVTLPVVLLMLDIYPLNRTALAGPTQQHQVSYQRLVVEKIPFFMFTIISVIITILAQHQGGAVSSLEQIGMLTRILNAFNSILFYISKLIFPVGLSPFYPYPTFTGFHEYYPYIIPLIAFLLITILSAYMWYKKKRYWLVAWLFYLVTLSPVLGIMQIGVQAAADRYVYLPTIPLYILAGLGIAHLLFEAKTRKNIKYALVMMVFLTSLGLVLMTQKQTSIWKNDQVFWSHIVSHAPESAFARFHLAGVYMEKGDYEKAIMHYRYAMLFESDLKWAVNLPIAYIELNQLQEAQNILDRLMAQSALETHRGYFYRMTGWIYFKQDRLQKAQETLEKAIQLDPGNKKIQHLLSEISARQ